MIRILLISTCILCLALGGCTDDNVIPASPIPFPSETVPVELTLTTEAYNALPMGETRAGEGNFAMSASYPDMDIELVGTPVTRAAATIDKENAIYNFTILQFAGTTADAKLFYKNTYPCPSGVIDTKTVEIPTTTTGIGGAAVKHRFVVIANVDASVFNSLQTTASSYTDFQNLYISRSGNEADFPLHRMNVNGNKTVMVMCGMADAVIASTGKQISIGLQRTVAKVTFNIKSDEPTIQAFPAWDVSLLNIPNKSYYNILGRRPVFPSPDVKDRSSSYWDKVLTAVPAGEALPVQGKSLYIPVNLQNTVNISTLQTRRSHAPLGGTYLQIMGRKMLQDGVGNIPVVLDFVIYQIFLGKNFTTDFSVYPNYNLTYNITLKGRSVDDSNVIRLIPGFFSGQLKAYSTTALGTPLPSVSDPAAVEWKYSQRLETYFQDSAYPSLGGPVGLGTFDLPWYAGGAYTNYGATDLMNGFENTRKLEQKPNTYLNYPAALACYGGLNGLNTSGVQTFSWYLPAIGELIGTWISSSSMASQQSPSYWSSTAAGAQAFVITNEGEVSTAAANSANEKHRVRGCRNPDNVSTN